MANRLESLEVARGIAATAVAFHHLTLEMAEPKYFGHSPWGSILFPGYHGVDFFFVLSGFIICYVHWEDIGRPSAVLRYAWRRVLRIVPPYWLVTGFVATVYLLAPDLGASYKHDPLRVLTSLLLLPVGNEPVLAVGWTLIYEAFFYILFGLIIWQPRLRLFLFPAWLLVIAIAIGHKSPTPAFAITAPVNLLFMMGIAAATIHRRRRLRCPLVWVGAGISAVSAVCAMEIIFTPRFGGVGTFFDIRDYGSPLVIGLASSAIILGLASWESQRPRNIRRPLRMIGAASYSMYLTHGVVISFGLTVLFKLRGWFPIDASLTILILICLALAGAILFWKTVEAPLLRRLRTTTVKRFAQVAPQAARTH